MCDGASFVTSIHLLAKQMGWMGDTPQNYNVCIHAQPLLVHMFLLWLMSNTG